MNRKNQVFFFPFFYYHFFHPHNGELYFDRMTKCRRSLLGKLIFTLRPQLFNIHNGGNLRGGHFDITPAPPLQTLKLHPFEKGVTGSEEGEWVNSKGRGRNELLSCYNLSH
jgi:hypothetical protein